MAKHSKVIFIMADSFRRDHLGAYGNKWIHTPNLDALAAMSSVFDYHFAGSYPTTPNRRDVHLGTGDKGRTFNHWRNIDADEIKTAQRLDEKGIPTMMITDVSNGVEMGANLFKGFSDYHVNRGQEGDRMWSDASVPMEYPVDPELVRYHEGMWRQVLENRAYRHSEEDFFAPGTYRQACRWLEQNYKRQDFFLWVETFDPHEPWDPPQYYTDRYDADYKGRVFEAPPYGFYKKMGITDREVRHLQARYAGECTMVDHCVGRLMATLEKTGLMDEVTIIFTTDHGIYAGYPMDNGIVGKPWVIDETRGAWLKGGEFAVKKEQWLPLRTSLLWTPLFIHRPGQSRTRRVGDIVQPWDMAPTILDLFGMKKPDEHIGQSLLPLTEGKKLARRPYAFSGAAQFDKCVVQTMNKRWLYCHWPDGQRNDALFNLKEDPDQKRDIADKHPDVCKKMRKAVEQFDPSIVQ